MVRGLGKVGALNSGRPHTRSLFRAGWTGLDGAAVALARWNIRWADMFGLVL